jgi:ABC-2 type transport system permease protein
VPGGAGRGLRVFLVGGLISYRALFHFLSPWIYVPSLLVAPIFQILLFAFIGRSAGLESDRFYLVGNAIQFASIPCLFAMTQAIAGERFQQTLGFILVSPAARLPLFLGRAVPVVLNAAVVSAFSLAVGALVLRVDVPAGSVAPLALVILVSAFSCTGLGLVTAGIGLRVRDSAVLCNVIFGVLLVFTGANAPLDSLPGWMRAAGDWMPLTHGIEAARELAAGGSLGDVAGLVGTEVLIGILYAAAGYAVIRWMEREGRVHASLEVA